MSGFPRIEDRHDRLNKQFSWLTLSVSKIHQAWPGAPKTQRHNGKCETGS